METAIAIVILSKEIMDRFKSYLGNVYAASAEG
jgi:hypothetical protein